MVTIEEWNRLVKDGLTEDFDKTNSNVRYDFSKMTKRFGLSYIEYLQYAYKANEGVLSDEEFRNINGGIPEGFFKKKVINE